ncbi:MAG: TraB family protein [bacterium]|nr:TraB family protein [bacterium]
MDLDGVDTLVLGTAHVSAQSVEDVREIVRLQKPDTVAVELCASRYDALTDQDRWRNLDLGRVIREKKIWLLASSLILSSFQKKIGELTGSKPGEEMLVAAQLADENGAKIALVDREVRITLARAWSRIGFFSRLWLISNLMASLLVSEDVEPDEIENLKQQDVFEDMISHLPPRYVSLKEVILDERDRYLAEKIRVAAREEISNANSDAASKAKSKKKAAAKTGAKRGKRKLFAVVGAGHLPGIRRVLESGEAVDIAELDEPPAKRRWKDIGSWVVFFGVFAAISALVSFLTAEQFMDVLYAWIIARSVGAGLGALIAWAHPLTIIATALIAPVSYFFGFIGVRLWMVSTLIELRFKKPRVVDFESIAEDTETFAKFRVSLYRNRVLHLFWIIFAVSTGLTIGNVVFLNLALKISGWIGG